MGSFLIGWFIASHLLFMTSQGQHQEAAASLKAMTVQDTTLIEGMALEILRQGVMSKDPQEGLLALFGASVALNEKAENLFETAYQSPHPEIQLAALSMIARSKTEMSLFILNQAMGHPHPLIRLEAAFLLAERKAPQASDKIESLMHKIIPEAHFLFPRLFAMVGDEGAKRNLRKLLNHPQDKVRTEAILAIADSGRDDLIREIRRAITHPDSCSKEAAACALGRLKDEKSIPQLEKLVNHPSVFVQIAALQALTQFKHPQVAQKLEVLAKQENLFAISALKECEESCDTLAELLKSRDRSVRLNATLALLAHKDKRALVGLPEILVKDAKDLCFIPIYSPAGALSAYKVIPSATQNLDEGIAGFEVSLRLREQVLTDSLELDDASFFQIAHLIMSRQQTDLVPMLMQLLESKGSETARQFLKQEEQRAGAPFIRASSALALYRMKEEGPYEAKLQNWLKQEAALDLIKFRPFVPWEQREGSLFELTPNEKAALYISLLEAFIQQNPAKATELLLDLIASGAGKNRFVLAGLLLRTIQ